MAITLQVDAEKFKALLLRYEVEMGTDARDVMRTQARLLTEKLLALTPPKTQAQGNRAVARDVKKLFKRVSTTGRFFEAPANAGLKRRLDRYSRTGNVAAVREVLRDIFHREPRVQAGITKAQQNAARTRNGAVPKTGAKKTLVVPPGAILAHTKSLQLNVGVMKAGLLKACRAFGATMPGWVGRHGGGNGSAVNGIAEKNPHFSITNASPGIGRFRELYRAALIGRIKAMEVDLRKWARVRAGKFKR